MTPAQARDSYRRIMNDVGETVYIRRYTGSGATRTPVDTACKAWVTGYDPKEIVGNIQQGDRKLIVLAADLSSFSLPIRKGDKVVVRTVELSIEGFDDSTRRVAGELVAIELQVRGG